MSGQNCCRDSKSCLVFIVSIPYMSGQNEKLLRILSFFEICFNPLYVGSKWTKLAICNSIGLFQSPICRVKIYGKVSWFNFEMSFQSPICRVKILVLKSIIIKLLSFNPLYVGSKYKKIYKSEGVARMFQSPICRVKMKKIRHF